MPRQPLPCCQAAVESRYENWLGDTGGRDHPWMLDNLEMVLSSAIGSANLLSGQHHSVRVAWIGRPGERFTWAQRLTLACSECHREVDLFVISSNAMFFLLRVLLTASTLFVKMRIEEGKTVFNYTDATDEQVAQVHAAMEIYRGHRELSDEGLKELFESFSKVPDVRLQGAAAFLYTGTVAWLLLHEIGHAIGERAGAAPQARQYLDAQKQMSLDPQRKDRWLDELSADLHATHLLAGAAANHLARSRRDVTNHDQAARDTGFGSGVVALAVFELFEGYDAGKRAITEKEIARAVEFRTHPPMRLRQHFLEVCGKAAGGVNPTMIEPWRKVLHCLFADYVDRHPMPE
jgi:hypothetical protein